MIGENKKDGRRYSAMIKKAGFDLITFLKHAFEERNFWTILRILLVTLWLGWSIPFGFILQKFKFFKKFGFSEMKKWGKRCLKIAKTNYEIIFEKQLDPAVTYMFASNHTSPFDIPILSATIPYPAAYIANKEFTSFFVTNYWVKSLGGVMVDKKSRSGLIIAYKAICNTMKKGNSLIIFPESVMSGDGKVKPFKRGGLSAAVEAKASIVPIYIYNARSIIKPGEMYVHKNVTIKIFFLSPIDTSMLGEEEKENIDALVYNKLKEVEEKLILPD
ncbi:MAG: lysophospholipid acyltransferase family protein [Exilispira sp.]